MKKGIQNIRMRWVGFGLVLAFCALASQLYNLQVRKHDFYAYRAIRQIGEELPLEEIPRGDILDRNGKSLLDKEKVIGVAVFPSLIEDKELVSRRLSSILSLDKDLILDKLKGQPLYLKLGISKAEAEGVKNLALRGVLVANKERRYGDKVLASHIIGHLGRFSSWQEYEKYKNRDKPYYYNELIGKSGLEKYYEEELKGVRYSKVVRAFFDNRDNFIPGLGINMNQDVDTQRKNIKLTIDRDIQSKVELVMDKKIKKGSVVIMDVHNGDIVAMASRPNFNPGKLDQLKYNSLEEGIFVDRSVALTPPGSVFKVIVAAAALENNLVEQGTPYFCAGEKDYLIKCTIEKGHGWLPFAKAMAVSCNPTFARVGLKVGPQLVEEYAKKLGLANQGIIGLPIKVDKRQNWQKIGEPNHFVNNIIGQGETLASPLQITAMMNTVASGGIYYQPRLVQAVINDKNQGEIIPGGKKRRVLSVTTAEALKEILFLVTAPGGTGEQGYINHWGSAGKTSSVEINKKQGIVNAWFSGFFPYEQPKYTITVMVEEGKSGGKTAAPIFKEIAEEILAGENN